jgi:putative cell wall-binding protein/streptogramin lyase
MLKRSLVLLLAVAVVLGMGMMPASADPYPSYEYQLEFGSFGAGDGQFWAPGSIGVVPWGDVYVSDPDRGRVQLFDANGTFESVVTTMSHQPGGIAWGNNALYVADNGGGRILILDSGGGYISEFGSLGSGDGQFDGPRGVAFDRFGNVYVTDAYDRIQKFTGDGTFLETWGSTGSGEGEFVGGAGGIVVGLNDYVYVADYANGRIQKLDLDGTYVDEWPAETRTLAIDGADNIFATEYGNNRVVKYSPDGVLLTSWGTTGTSAGQFQGPGGIGADRWRRVYVSDFGNYRVQRFFSPVPTTTSRVAGTSRIGTAIAASQRAYPRGLRVDSDGYKTVIVATAYNFPDALGGAALAGVLDAPILLVAPTALPSEVADEIQRLDATRVVVLGGTAAVSDDVAVALDSIPSITTVQRIGGGNRSETADNIAREVARIRGVDHSRYAFVATALNFPDALAASPLSASRGAPIFLAGPGGLSSDTLQAMLDTGVTHVVILGGTAAVPPVVEAQVGVFALSIERLGGAGRYHTAVLIAEYGVEVFELSTARMALATGLDFPDALSGGALQGRYRSVLLLTDGQQLESHVAQYLTDQRDGIYELNILGGQNAVGQSVVDAGMALLR